MPIQKIIEFLSAKEVDFIKKSIACSNDNDTIAQLEHERLEFCKINEYVRLISIQLKSNLAQQRESRRFDYSSSESGSESDESSSNDFSTDNSWEDKTPIFTLETWITKKSLLNYLREIYHYCKVNYDENDLLVKGIQDPNNISIDELSKIYTLLSTLDPELTPRKHDEIIQQSLNLPHEPVTDEAKHSRQLSYIYWLLFDLVKRPTLEGEQPFILLPKLHSILRQIDNLFDEEYIACFFNSINDDICHGGMNEVAKCIQKCADFFSSLIEKDKPAITSKKRRNSLPTSAFYHGNFYLILRKTSLLFNEINDVLLNTTDSSLTRQYSELYSFYYENDNYSLWQVLTEEFDIRCYLTRSFLEIVKKLADNNNVLTPEIQVSLENYFVLESLYLQLIYTFYDSTNIVYNVTLLGLIEAVNHHLTELRIYGFISLKSLISQIDKYKIKKELGVDLVTFINDPNVFLSAKEQQSLLIIALEKIKNNRIVLPSIDILFDLIYALNLNDKNGRTSAAYSMEKRLFGDCLANLSLESMRYFLETFIKMSSLPKPIKAELKKLTPHLNKFISQDIVTHYQLGKIIDITKPARAFLCLLHYHFAIHAYINASDKRIFTLKEKLAYREACKSFANLIKTDPSLLPQSLVINICHQVLISDSPPSIKAQFFHLWLDYIVWDLRPYDRLLFLTKCLSDSNQEYHNPYIEELTNALIDIVTVDKSPYSPEFSKNIVKKIFHYFNTSPFFKEKNRISSMGLIIKETVYNWFLEKHQELISPIVDGIITTFNDQIWSDVFEQGIKTLDITVSDQPIIAILKTALEKLYYIKYLLNEQQQYYLFEEFAVIKRLTLTLSHVLMKLQLTIEEHTNISDFKNYALATTLPLNAVFPLSEDIDGSALYLQTLDEIFFLFDNASAALDKIYTSLSRQLSDSILVIFRMFFQHYHRFCAQATVLFVREMSHFLRDPNSEKLAEDLQAFKVQLNYYLRYVIEPSYTNPAATTGQFLRIIQYYKEALDTTSIRLNDLLNLATIHNSEIFRINHSALSRIILTINELNLSSTKNEPIATSVAKTTSVDNKHNLTTSPARLQGKERNGFFYNKNLSSSNSKSNTIFVMEERKLKAISTPSPSRAP